MKSILVKERGGVDVLKVADVPKPKIETDDILSMLSWNDIPIALTQLINSFLIGFCKAHLSQSWAQSFK
jgi:hypothetical protein